MSMPFNTFIPLNSILHIVGVGWLNLIIHFFCPITCKLGVFIHFVLSFNQFEQIDHYVNNLQDRDYSQYLNNLQVFVEYFVHSKDF